MDFIRTKHFIVEVFDSDAFMSYCVDLEIPHKAQTAQLVTETLIKLSIRWESDGTKVTHDQPRVQCPACVLMTYKRKHVCLKAL